MLNLIQEAFKQNGIHFRRIDGQTSLLQRTAALEEFQSEPDCGVLLASIGSIGEGWVQAVVLKASATCLC